MGTIHLHNPYLKSTVWALLNIAKTLNAGKDLAGNDLDAPTNFYIGATGNPGAPDLEIERQKLAAKIQNGAHFVQTQPIYDLEQAKHYIDKMSEFDVPIMLGLIPLKSFKMATYLLKKCLESILLKKSWTAWKKVVKKRVQKSQSKHLNKSRKWQQAYILCL